LSERDVESSVITSTIEDYLESILFISEEKGVAQVTEIAKRLSISKASVTEMISKLKKLGFVHYEKYGTITLTKAGLEIATHIKTRHELLESFLTLIGVGHENASKDCCVMEHNLSKETVEKLNDFYEFLADNNQADILERFVKYCKK